MDDKQDERDEQQNVNGEAGDVIHHEGADPDEEKHESKSKKCEAHEPPGWRWR